MNKKLFLGMFAAAGMLMATSCQNDELDAVQSGKESVVSFTLEQPGIATRAYSDGLTAKTLTYAVYEAGTQTVVTQSEDEVTFTNKTATVNLRLVTGKSYDILFWADAENAPYTFDARNQTITVANNLTSQDESRDAFFAAEKSLLVDGAINKTITLYCPFAQLNIGTTDAEEDAVKNYAPIQSSVTVKNVYNTLNLLSGEVTGATGLTYAMANIPGEGETFPVDGVKYLSMNYLLVDAEKELVDVEFTVSNGSHTITREYTAVPVQRNYRTNIYGKILTDPADFNIIIEEEYEKPDYEVVVWDGKTVTEPTSNDTEWTIATAAEWIYLTQKGAGNKNIKLVANIDFGGHEIKAITSWQSLDGQGFTISNFTMLPNSSGYTTGLFQGDGHTANATIKNVTIENVKAVNKTEEYGWIGVIGGNIENTSVVNLEKVTVRNADLCGVKNVAGLIGYVASGATLNIKDCLVDGSYFHNFAVAGESGYVAGLVGRPVGTVNVTNSNVTNTTIDAYYAAPDRTAETIQPLVGNKPELTAGETVIVKKTSLEGATYISSVAGLKTLQVKDKVVILSNDIDCGNEQVELNIISNCIFDGNGHKISNVKTINRGGSSSLFRGDNGSDNNVIKNLIVDGITTFDCAGVGYSFASAAIWSDVQNNTNLTIDNVHIYNATIPSGANVGGFVGFIGGNAQGLTIKNSSINSSSITGGNANRIGALVGRAYGCAATLENVVVDGVIVNGVAATTSTLVKGEKGYTGTVTVK